MKVLVTGATGFIGKRLTLRLREKGYQVVCLVRKTSRVEPLKEAGCKLEVSDILDEHDTDRLFSMVLPDIVFHCAARVKDESEDEIFNTNIDGTRNIAEACLKYGVKRLVYLSSVAVVSGNPEVPLVEELPYNATSIYGVSKVESEKIALEYRDKGLSVAIIRPCMVYGEDEPHAQDRIFGLIAKRRLPVICYPGLREKLHLVYVENVVDALLLAMEKPAALSGSFFIADREVITITRFIEIVSEETGVPPFVLPDWAVKIFLMVPVIKKKFNRIFKDRVYDISRAQALLGYDPKISTEEGLRRAVMNWQEKQ